MTEYKACTYCGGDSKFIWTLDGIKPYMCIVCHATPFTKVKLFTKLYGILWLVTTLAIASRVWLLDAAWGGAFRAIILFTVVYFLLWLISSVLHLSGPYIAYLKNERQIKEELKKTGAHNERDD